MEIQAGQVAKSLRGHDKDEIFVIIKTEENYAYIVDGKLRMLDDPKKKKENLRVNKRRLNGVVRLDLMFSVHTL